MEKAIIVEDNAWHRIEHRYRVERWENAERVLLSMDKHTREKHFDMSTWLYRNDCGTVGCLAGHCALDPYFNSLGLIANWLPVMARPINSIGKLARCLFGDDGFQRVLLARDFDDIEQRSPNWEEVAPILRRFIEDLKAGKISRNDPYYWAADSWEFRNRRQLLPEQVA